MSPPIFFIVPLDPRALLRMKLRTTGDMSHWCIQ